MYPRCSRDFWHFLTSDCQKNSDFCGIFVYWMCHKYFNVGVQFEKKNIWNGKCPDIAVLKR